MTEQLEKRVSGLERRVTEIERKLASKPLKPKKSKPKRLSDRILELRNGGFFTAPKTDVEVHRKLENTGYHCEPNRVSVALFRMGKKGELRKTSKDAEGKTRVAYAW